MKIVYIAHPIGGDVQNNIRKVLDIVRMINLTYNNVVPFAPYIVDVQALDDSIEFERQRGIANNIALFDRGVIDEVWLYGDRISKGMAAEVVKAWALKIPVKGMTKETAGHLTALIV